MYFISSKCRFTFVKSLLKLMLCGTVLGFVIESGSVFVNPSRVAHASQTKVFLSNPSFPVSVDGITVKRFDIHEVIAVYEVIPMCDGGPWPHPLPLRFRPQALVGLHVVNEQLEPVNVKYRLQVTNPFTSEVLGERSIQYSLSGKDMLPEHNSHKNAQLGEYGLGFLNIRDTVRDTGTGNDRDYPGSEFDFHITVYLDETKYQLPDKLSFTVTIETNRSSIAYVLKAPEYIVGEELKKQYDSARITESTTSTQLMGCFRPSDADGPKVVRPRENERSHVQVPKVVRPRNNEGLQRRAVSPRQILLVPVKKLSPTVSQERLMPTKRQKETRKTNVSAN